jgi:hypothetical protein
MEHLARGQDLPRNPSRIPIPKETAAPASQPDPALQAEYPSEIKQAQDPSEKAKAKVEQADLDMFQLYANLLPIDAKYT